MDHREWIAKIKEIVPGISHEKAGELFGYIVEEKMLADRAGYIRGYNNGVEDEKEKWLEDKEGESWG